MARVISRIWVLLLIITAQVGKRLPLITGQVISLAFFAYAPQTPSGTVSIENAAKKITDFSPAQAVTGQKDLVISYNTGTKALNENSGVAMNFKHALSQIEVKAKCSNDKIKIEIMGVKLVNAAAKADFTFPETETIGFALQQSQWSN